MADLQAAGGWATVALGLGQALAPQATAKAFGMAPLDDQGTWLARLLGTSNVAWGALALDDARRHHHASVARGVLAGNALVTVVGAATGAVPKRTAGLVLGFLAALAAAEATGG